MRGGRTRQSACAFSPGVAKCHPLAGYNDRAVTTAPDLSSETAGEHALVQRFWLLVVAGPDAGATLTSSSDRTVIGTYDTCDLVLRDSTVSRFHCEMGTLAGRPFLRDLGSLNGTTVNGVGIVAAHLVSGATIGLGRTQIRFDVGAESLKLALSARTRFGGLAGRSPAMRRAFALLERAAATDQTVVLEGEPGTGRRTAAAAVHAESARRDGPFVAVDCSAVTGERLEAELFGTLDGRAGAFEAARGGTLYLGEIADVPLELQPRLLRALERKESTRLGAVAPTPIDVRVVAGTHRALRTEVNAKRFRSDLYFRLCAQEVRLPPLRERDGDVPVLIADLTERWLGKERAPAVVDVLAEHLGRLEARDFPGNVAELAAALARALEAVPGPRAAAAELPLQVGLAWHLRAEEKRWAAALLARYGDEDSAARAGGIDRLHLRRLLTGR